MKKKEPKTKAINVALTTQTKTKLKDLSNKYHLSWSTMANIILKEIFLHTQKDELNKLSDLTKNYLSKDREMSRLKIDKQLLAMEFLGNKVNIKLITNLLMYFCENNEFTKKFNTKIYNEFQNTFDPNYKFNQQFRQLCKIAKSNKKYFKETFLNDN